jgi:hypothetical protein
MLPGAGAAQYPQNQLHSTVVSKPPSTSLKAGLFISFRSCVTAHPRAATAQIMTFRGASATEEVSF